MRIEELEIHAGEPPFSFESIRPLEATCEAMTVFTTPTMDQVNMKLREMAAGLGANAVIRVEYKRGVSMTSWKSLRATSLAVRKQADEIKCPVCAETIKRAAVKCRFCGADVPNAGNVAAGSTNVESALSATEAAQQSEPMRSTDNPVWLVVLVALALGILVLFYWFSVRQRW